MKWFLRGWGLALFLLAAVYLLFAWLPFDRLKPLLDSLPRDGEMASFTPEIHQRLKTVANILGFIFLSLSMSLILWTEKARHWLKLTGRTCSILIRQLKFDLSDLFKQIRRYQISRMTLILLAGIILLGLSIRLALINKPLHYDEAYTYCEFARHSLRHILSDYHVPNNHVFNTLLIHLFTCLFGNAKAVLRLPTLIAGIMLVPTVYLLGERVTGRTGGLAAALLTAVMPPFVYYGTQARGYAMVQLCTVLLFILGYAVRRRNNMAVWCLIVLVATTGFYNVPIMIYPFGCWLLWMTAFVLHKDLNRIYRSRRRWLLALGICTVMTAALAWLLYLPLAENGRVDQLFLNIQGVRISLNTLLLSFPSHVMDVVREWTLGIPSLLAYLMALCLLASLFAQTTERQIISMQSAFLLYVIPLILVQKPIFIARIWSFLLPLAAVWAAQGLLVLLSLFNNASLRHLLLGLFLAAITISCTHYYVVENDTFKLEIVGDEAEEIVGLIKPNFGDGDIFVVSPQADAKYWYAFERYGLPENGIRGTKLRSFERMFVLIYPGIGETLSDVVESYGPGTHLIDIESAKIILEDDVYRLYRIAALRE